MNFGYVTVNGVDSNVAGLHAIVDWIVCIISTSEKALYANIMLQKGVVINN